MADRIVKPDSGNDLVLQNDDASAKIEVNEDATVNVTSGTDDDISLIPGGTGELKIGSGSASGKITSSGAHDLVLDTNSGTNSGTITITDGSDGDIDITPNGSGEVNLSKVDIDAGTIDGATIATSDVTVGAGKTLNVSAGTFTSSGAQKQAILDGGTVTETHGGTGETSYTQGDILYSNGSNSLAKLGAGTSGQFLKTQGSGANPAWATANVGWNLIEEKIISSEQSSGVTMGSASLFSSTYDVYKLMISNICLTNNQHFQAKMGISGVLKTADYQYMVKGYDANDNQYRAYSTSASAIELATMGTHGSDDSIAEFEITIAVPNLTKAHMFRWQWILRSEDGSGYPAVGYGGARYNGSGTFTEINILGASSVHIDQGNFQLYGLITN